jgi:hypothetical protein
MGGDTGIMGALYDEMTGKGNPVSSYIQSHIMAYAAEESRISDKKIDIRQFEHDMIDG